MLWVCLLIYGTVNLIDGSYEVEQGPQKKYVFRTFAAVQVFLTFGKTFGSEKWHKFGVSFSIFFSDLVKTY